MPASKSTLSMVEFRQKVSQVVQAMNTTRQPYEWSVDFPDNGTFASFVWRPSPFFPGEQSGFSVWLSSGRLQTRLEYPHSSKLYLTGYTAPWFSEGKPVEKIAEVLLDEVDALDQNERYAADEIARQNACRAEARALAEGFRQAGGSRSTVRRNSSDDGWYFSYQGNGIYLSGGIDDYNGGIRFHPVSLPGKALLGLIARAEEQEKELENDDQPV